MNKPAFPTTEGRNAHIHPIIAGILNAISHGVPPMATPKQSFVEELCEAVRNGASESDVLDMLDKYYAPEPSVNHPHLLVCNYPRGPIGAAGCICKVVNKNDSSPEPGAKCDCWETVNALIKPGQLQGNGWDKTAERNGIILAANALLKKRNALTKGGES